MKNLHQTWMLRICANFETKADSDLRITLKIFELLKTSTCLINIPELYVFKIGFGSFLTKSTRAKAGCESIGSHKKLFLREFGFFELVFSSGST